MDYSKLSPNKIAYLCRRYGHKESITRKDVVCLRCGFSRPHKDSNEILAAYMTPSLEEIKQRLEWLNKIATFPKSKKGQTITFNRYDSLSTK